MDDSGSDSHWVNGGRELLKGLILDALLQPIEDRHLGYVRQFFHAKGTTDKKGNVISGQRRLLGEMVLKTNAFDGVLSGIAAAYLTKNEREFNSIVSVGSVQLAFLDSKPLMSCLRESSFKLSELKTGKTTVYLCLPASRMATHGKWFRSIVMQTLLMAENVETVHDAPLLMLLEELPVLGYVRQLEMAAGLIASLGVRLFCIIQDLTQLQRFYKATWETFLGNSGVTIFFGNSDVTTLEYVSKKLGTLGFEIGRTSRASPSQQLAGARVSEEHFQLSKLLEPHEVEQVFARKHLRALIMSAGEKPVVVQRARYYKDDAFRELL